MILSRCWKFELQLNVRKKKERKAQLWATQERGVKGTTHQLISDQCHHTLLRAVLWPLHRKMQGGKRDLCFPKKKGVAQSAAFLGWSFQFPSFPVVVRGVICLVFQQIRAPAGILPLQLLLSCFKHSGCCHLYQKGGRMVLLCSQTCWNVPLCFRHWEQAVLIVKP